ncbi:MAG TPA: transaldolase family protein [Candidatus Woesebacteria bacterium]|nr:transaldolase family protein [Candidatus Woesebacteria bacterium]HRS22598.1 transaldolase family protein [Candidatus Woesebacteria bacterium]HRT40232.1 transaldolase family protein [Candidatus Woesebacteria bacterium]
MTKIFADTADLSLIKELLAQGVPIDGVTTNPSLLQKAMGEKKFSPQELDRIYINLLREIRKILPQGSISGEIFITPKTPKEEIYRLAEKMSDQVSRIHIKIPIFKAGLAAAADFVKRGGRVNMTLCFSLEQAAAVERIVGYLSKNDQVYVSPFIGRLNDIGLRGMSLIENIQRQFTKDKAKTKLLAASIRSKDQFYDCLALKVDIVTVPPQILFEWKGDNFKRPKNIKYVAPHRHLNIKHPLTDKGFDLFIQSQQALLK